MSQEDDYAKYRGKCMEMSKELCDADPTLTLVRGHYHCPYWGEQAHWWVKDKDGNIIDPTKNQFPSKGVGEYLEFNGICHCANCDKEFKEEAGTAYGNYIFCSDECIMRFVGV